MKVSNKILPLDIQFLPLNQGHTAWRAEENRCFDAKCRADTLAVVQWLKPFGDYALWKNIHVNGAFVETFEMIHSDGEAE